MINIVYEDKSIVVCLKPVGVVSEDRSENSLPQFLREQLNCDIYPIHRLDQVVSGLIVYGKTPQAAGKLSGILNEESFNKEYLAICENTLSNKEAILTDLLFHDKNKNKSFVVNKKRANVKEAKLAYKVIEEKEDMTLIKVKLYTGRTHQIRVQLANNGNPLVGDGKYGSKNNKYTCALYSYKLAFIHPFTKKKLEFQSLPKQKPFTFFNLEKL